MVRLLKKFIAHQIALLHNEAVNPPIIAWIATILFVPSGIVAYYFTKYLLFEIIPFVNIPLVLKTLIFLLTYIFCPFILPFFVGNNAR